MRYGPFGYAQAAVVGFLLGSAIFLVGDAAVQQHDVSKELPAFLTFAGAATAAILLGAAVANYLVGRRILEELQLQKKVFAGGKLPPPMPRPDVPGIDLLSSEDALSAEVEIDQAA